MKIIDLTEEYEDLYLVCLEDWSDDMKEAGSHKCNWYTKMKSNGLGVKLAIDDDGKVGGMIQYLPIEHSEAEGENIYFIKCIWVHGHKAGRGNFQGKGMGKALLEAAENDAKSKGANGMAAWGISLPFWMKASWFKKQGYKKVDKQSIQLLMWKPFSKDAKPPKWIKPIKKPEANANPGKITITAFNSGWCQVENIVYERVLRASKEFGDKVVFKNINTLNRDTFLEWGISDAVFIEDKEVQTGPPPTYEKIYGLIAKQVKKIKI
ncbi:MAG: GNAT family N-acetyltransferase [Eubacteriales bacterium]